MAMADVTARKAQPRATPYKIYDELGLYLLVNPGGSKLWRFKYSFAGKERLLAIGSYPLRSLREARGRRDDARRLLSDGIDPGLLRAQTKLRQLAAAADSFEAVGREWFAKFSPHWAKSHADKVIRRLELYVFPWLGKRPISELEPLDVLSVLRRIESRGLLETAHRVHQNCSQVFRYGVATGRAKRDVTVDLRGALAPWRPQHYPSITDPQAVGELLRAIHGYKGGLVVASALKLAPLVFTRPGELRRAEWAELNLDAAEWRIPADKMKAGVPHVVPLSRQAVGILRELRPLTGSLQYVFPSRNSRKKPMSENTVNAALRRLGYDKGHFTGHGFRSMASTILNEQGWKADVIERQLAHGERDKVRAAYNYAQHLAERRKMMQAWADYPYSSGKELLEIGRRSGLRIDQIMLVNECTWRDEGEVWAGIHHLWKAMHACIERGMAAEGNLPGPLNLARRAPGLARQLQRMPGEDPLRAMDWLNVYAIAVNEENAAGGRVVTAPTNGAAGIVPAVARYYWSQLNGDTLGIERFFLASAAIGVLYKENASISGAEVGCQGEVGVACSMAAAGLAAALGGSNEQVEHAAEIGMEHNLGMTCDPVGGLVQIPCIERNAFGAVKAVNAARMALRETGGHKVSLDQVIKTMYQTGLDMQSRYKETALGGLAVNVVEC